MRLVPVAVTDIGAAGTFGQSVWVAGVGPAVIMVVVFTITVAVVDVAVQVPLPITST